MFKDLSSHIHTIYHKVKLPESLVKLIPTNNQVLGILPPALYNFPPAVYRQLTAFKEKRGLESIEMAVTVIVEEYFGFTQTLPGTEADTTSSRLETLEAKCTSLSNTVGELTRAIALLQASNSQPVDYQGTPLHQHSPLPLQDKSAGCESINNHSVDQNELLEPSAANDLQTNSSSAEQLPILESPTERQSALNLSVEYTQAPLTGASASTRGSEDIEPESAPNIQKQSSLEQASDTISIISMTGADLALRLGVATSTVSRMQSKPNFPDWSKQRDPDGIAWAKSLDTKLFYPQNQK